MPTKQCPACKETKDAEQFYWNRKRKCLGTYCKPCHKLVQRRWQQQNPEKVAEISRRRKQRRLEVQKITRYGVTPERYAEMLSDQDFGCAICASRRPLKQTTERLEASLSITVTKQDSCGVSMFALQQWLRSF